MQAPVFVISHRFNDSHGSQVVVEALDFGAWGMIVNLTLYRGEVELHHCEWEEFTPKLSIFQNAARKSKILHGRRQFRNSNKWDDYYFALIVQTILNALSFQEGTEEGDPVCMLTWNEDVVEFPKNCSWKAA